jgi:protein phosphatase
MPPPDSDSAAVLRVDAAARSHPGRVRKRNEDHFVFGRFGRFVEIGGSNLPADSPVVRREESAFYALVADGVGGRAGGDQASRRAIELAYLLQLARRDWILRPAPEDLPELMRRMDEHLQEVDRRLARHAEVSPGLEGMRTTLTACAILGDVLLVGHVGDSRAYLFRRGRLHALTRDQTMARLLADLGEIESREIDGHHLSHVLTQAVGAGEELAVDVRHLPVRDGDRLLLASDGLAAVASETEIERLMAAAPDPEEAVERLLELALDRGAPDNVTLLVARVTAVARTSTAAAGFAASTATE